MKNYVDLYVANRSFMSLKVRACEGPDYVMGIMVVNYMYSDIMPWLPQTVLFIRANNTSST